MTAADQPTPSVDGLLTALAERDQRIARQAVLIREGVGREAVLTARIAELEERDAAKDARIAALEALVADVARKLGKDSQNSSKPPSSDGLGSRAERRRQERERRRTEPAEGPKDAKKRGGQPGHPGGGLAFTATPDDVRVVEPGPCGGCGADLAGAPQVRTVPLQVVDIPEIRALVTQFLLVSRRCGCGTVTRAAAPEGAVGAPVCYGPNLSAASLLLHTFGQLGQERAAETVNGLFGTAVSTGWINKIAARFAAGLRGFEADAKTALLTEQVLLADETPVNTAADSPEADGADPVAGAARTFKPCVFTLRSEKIVWLGAGHTRGHAAMEPFDVFGRFTGTLVTDDWGGYLKYEQTLKARQLCNAHLIRSARGIAAEPGQGWATTMIAALRAGRAAVKAAITAGAAALTAEQIEQVRAEYTAQATAGMAVNRARRTANGGRHPGWVLAKRLLDKIDQVLHHLTDFAVPWTSNLAEQALRHVKVHLKTSGCFRTLATTRAYCRIHSYLITIRLHGVDPMKAIRDALAGRAWTPLRAVTAH